MKIKTADLQNILTTWIENKVLPKSNAFQAMAVTFAMLQAGDKISRITPLLMPDADGRIDLDKTIENARTALRKAGGRSHRATRLADGRPGKIVIPVAGAAGGVGWHEELTDIEIDKVLDAVRIIEICKRNGTK